MHLGHNLDTSYHTEQENQLWQLEASAFALTSGFDEVQKRNVKAKQRKDCNGRRHVPHNVTISYNSVQLYADAVAKYNVPMMQLNILTHAQKLTNFNEREV